VSRSGALIFPYHYTTWLRERGREAGFVPADSYSPAPEEKFKIHTKSRVQTWDYLKILLHWTLFFSPLVQNFFLIHNGFADITQILVIVGGFSSIICTVKTNQIKSKSFIFLNRCDTYFIFVT
jgi:hypothetical protein